MPSQYEALVAALKLTSYPVAEYGWASRPEGAFWVTGLDFESGSLNGDGVKQDRSWEGSLHAFFRTLTERDDMVSEAEEILTEIFGASWEMNSLQHERDTGLFHVEWVFTALDTPQEEPEPAPEADMEPESGDA